MDKAVLARVLDAYAEELRADCPPGIWSRGVALSRENRFLIDRCSDDEIRLRVQSPDRPVAREVSLWPAESDSFCNCGDRQEPCIHVIAALLWLRTERGTAAIEEALTGVAAGSTTSLASPFRTLEYRFSEHPDHGLILERWLTGAGAAPPEKLTTTLVSRLSAELHGSAQAAGNGRLSSTQADVQADALIGPNPGSWSRVRDLPVRKLFQALASVGNVTLAGTPLRVNAEPIRPRAELVDNPSNGGFTFRPVRTRRIAKTWPEGVTLTEEGEFHPIDVADLTADELAFFKNEAGTTLSGAALVNFLTHTLPRLQTLGLVTIGTDRLPRLDAAPVRLEFETSASDHPGTCHFVARLVYGDPPIATLAEGELRPTAWGLENRTLPMRDRAEEARLLSRLETELRLGTETPHRLTPGGLARVADWVRRQPPTDRPRITGEAGWTAQRPTAVFTLVENPETGLPMGGEFRVPGGGGGISFDAVWENWDPREPWVGLPAGGYAKLPADWLEEYGPRFAALFERLSSRAAKDATSTHLALDGLCEESHTDRPAALAKLRSELDRDLAPGEIAAALKTLPPDVRLRPYQEFGVRWLAARRARGIGCILADDMGLGKTLQALAVVQGPALVLAPASVVAVWGREAARFRPDLRVRVYHGADRNLQTEPGPTDLVLTSYATARIDLDVLAKFHWRTLIADEAQTIRNRESQTTQAVMRLRTRDQPQFRLAVTGTPIENRAEDLLTLLEFANPGLFAETETALKAGRIQPFVLRRRKNEVARDLPPRTEAIVPVALDEDERKTYESLHLALRADVAKLAAADPGRALPLSILEVLLRLRQSCCDTALLPGGSAPGAAGDPPSSKTRTVVEKAAELVAEGHRCLIFSQWTSYLDRVGAALESASLDYERLDGSTPTSERQRIVERFQQQSGSASRILLLSLKAGGVGLTLTAADHVFILDPWWNPAVEDQAADRAHRIGQERPVFIHRLVAERTVEERVLSLQARKRALAASLLDSSGDRETNAELTRDDLLDLLANAAPT